ncbi:hypothetical protein LAZ67_21001993 [Cordylochernes scorpioides]|uniref:Uncharacterized protein n=1 Tax=Cordylochernes scorpioides TaxID=51811 RepID=A0ABY6LQJ5_9ARAC|nr:hypothetical protein LAZ67_21001993 [Cordylochernes scorpioides]
MYKLTVLLNEKEIWISFGWLIVVYRASSLELPADLGYRYLCSKWVPKLLTREIIQSRKEICLDLIESYPGPASEAFKGVKTCNKTWVYHYDSYSKRQSMQWSHKMSPGHARNKILPKTRKYIVNQYKTIMSRFNKKAVQKRINSNFIRTMRELTPRNRHWLKFLDMGGL